MNRESRIAAVTLGLMGAGAIFGALAGAIALGVSLLVTENDAPLFGLVFGAWFGAPLGAVTAPVIGWLGLRRVPLGRMFLESAVGTTIGGIVGWVAATASGTEVVNGLAGAFIGCLAAAVRLRYCVRALPRALNARINPPNSRPTSPLRSSTG